MRQASLAEEEGGNDLKLWLAAPGASPTDDDGGRHVESESCVIVSSTRATVITKRRQRCCGPRSWSRNDYVVGAEAACEMPKATSMRVAECHGLKRIDPTGIVGTRHVTKGCPGTWEVSPLCREIGTIRQGRSEPVGRREVGALRKSTDVGELAPGDPAEQRTAPRNRTLEGKMKEPPSSANISTKLERIAKQAKEIRGVGLKTLAHNIDLDWMREAHRRTRKDGATGVDGRSAEQFAEQLEGNLQSLLDCAKSGRYRAPPVRRVHIPKGNGTDMRPIGIPTFEDKVLQRAVAMVIEAVYEQSFHDFSYGFRPGRSAHQALETLQNAAVRVAGGWIVEVDIRKFFDTVDHAHMHEILRRRIRDEVLLRLIGKWLNAGVLEGKTLSHPYEGTPQGGVISPLLANIYLHEVLDEWFVNQVRPHLEGPATLVRYADDFVVLFSGQAGCGALLRGSAEAVRKIRPRVTS